jgi:hypothetical protein
MLAGRVIARHRGRRPVVTVDLRGRPQGAYRVAATARLSNGKRRRWRATYHTCVP